MTPVRRGEFAHAALPRARASRQTHPVVTVPADVLSQRLEKVRRRTRWLTDHLDAAALTRRADEIMSPPVWDLGHIAAQEELWLVRRLRGTPSRHPELEAAYDAALTPRVERTEVPILGVDEVREYMAEVRSDALDVLADTDLSPDGPELTADGFVFEMVVEHEAQHSETMLQAFKLLPPGGYVPPERSPVPAPTHAPERVEVPGGTFTMGAGERGFAYDCERAQHAAEVRTFWIDTLPTSNAAHRAFIDDGGYRRREFWSDEGWAWRTENGVEAPLYWERDGEGGWLERSFELIDAVVPDSPVCHISWYEADAHARWAGGRLPTEREWERAGIGGGEGTLDQVTFRPAPCGAHDARSDVGCRQMHGEVWEWTSSGFTAYPGFEAFPYPEYSEVFFGGPYKVLRGGSWATQPEALRPTFRNWDRPQRRQIFSGMRMAWDTA